MVETSRLESGHTRKGIGGSNPSLSARFSLQVFSREVPRLTAFARDFGSRLPLRSRLRNASSSNPSLSAILPYLIIGAFAALHLPLLRLPFFWDEAGYYVPAARDLYLTGSLIPHSTLHTAHTPLLSILLAVVWKITGYGILSTKVTVLAIACFGLWQVYRLAQNVSNQAVSIGTLLLTACYSVIFAQSSLAQADILATALTWWGLREYYEAEPTEWRYALAFALAAMAKEIAIVVPLALAAFELVRSRRKAFGRCLALCGPATVLLVLWFAYQRAQTGAFFGDAGYYQYNVTATLSFSRIALAFLQRVWQAFGHVNMWAATLTTIVAMMLLPKRGRERIAIRTQLAFGTIILAMLIFHSVLGGALLTRYLLPIFPLIIVVFVSTWWRRIPHWEWLTGVIALLFAVACVVNPPYRFAPEDDLNYADFVRLHQQAAKEVAQRFPSQRIVTAWPATDELGKPELGYSSRPIRAIEIKDFTAPEIAIVREQPFDAMLAFSTKYEPPRAWFQSQWWLEISARYFDYHRDLKPEQIANELSGRVVWQQSRGGQWIALIARELPEDAQLAPRSFDPADSHVR